MTACLAAVIAAFAITASASASATVGISDQQASTFSNPLYKPLKMKVARYIAPYDVMSDPVQKANLDAWIKGARKAHQKILVSFEHSRRAGHERKVPSNSSYKKAVTSFKKKYGSKVESISPWNEVNVCQRGGRTEGQPSKICHVSTGPKIVAGYYKTARKVFRGKKIVGLDILDGVSPNAAVSYIKKFRRYAKPFPTYWGIHNYSDTNRGSTSRTSKLIKAIGSRRAKIWLTETGGQLHLQTHNFGEAKAAKALKCMFYMPKKFRQIQRLYVYQFNGAGDALIASGNYFDAGLISATNQKRPGYKVVQKRQSAKCHR